MSIVEFADGYIDPRAHSIGDGVEAARWVPAWSMDRLLRDRWYRTPDERSEGQVAQLQWPHIVDPMVVSA